MHAMKNSEGRPRWTPTVEIQEVRIEFPNSGLPQMRVKGLVMTSRRAYRSGSSFDMAVPLPPEIGNPLQNRLAEFVTDMDAVQQAIADLQERLRLGERAGDDDE